MVNIMKTLQNDFTTPEQSKRLLELGLPAWTANIMFDKNRRRYELIETEDESLAETQRTLFYNGGAIPHWSVGRLIEIYGILRGVKCIFSLDTTDIINNIIACFERNKLDFSKLEE